MKRPLISPYHVVVENGKRVLVSDCQRILEYSPEKIRIRLGRASVTLRGRGLTLCDFFGNEIQVNGSVESIAFAGENDEE